MFLVSLSVPLKSVGVDVEVRDHVASVVSTLNYENSEDKAIEAVFVFPLPGDAAVCHFSATVGQKEIVAEVKEKQQVSWSIIPVRCDIKNNFCLLSLQAHEEYDDALSSGQQAFLLEESDETPDIFSLRVGSLPPGQSASIRLEYVIELAVEADDGLRFCLPAVLNPRYQPQGRLNLKDSYRSFQNKTLHLLVAGLIKYLSSYQKFIYYFKMYVTLHPVQNPLML